MRLMDLGRGCFEVPERLRAVEVRGVACDSRQVKPGDLFVAVRGETTDGHRFLRKAEELGAVAAVVETDRLRRSPPLEEALPRRVPLIEVDDSRQALGRLAANLYGTRLDGLAVTGVTGTKGKTTTTWMLDSVLRGAGKVSALLGTVLNRVGARVYPSDNTTPGCLDLHRYLKELADQGGTHAVLEVSSHGILQRRTAGIPIRCGVFTNVAPEHLDYHKTFESYVQTKVSFFAELPPGSFAVVSREDPVSRTIASRTRAHVAWYGADLHDGVEDLRMAPEGLRFRWKGVLVRSRLWGHHNLLNILGAMTAAECLGVSRDDIRAGIEAAEAPPGRLERIDAGQPFQVFVDYAHTDGSLETVLSALRGVTPGRLIAVFGCGGDRDRTKRPRMGRVAERHADQVIVTSDNPRSEDPRKIIEDVMEALERPEDAVSEVDRRDAIALG
ncbi:MAG: UDP-N-acetylmuramoyl-L-alanyl-D-glutamate--2,6-diaminopimelate ligase, partial [Planctomycetes bacterium]|nr:UDP-N-acetylmuramoyl-L-alanyl-D-glutamate--2,6-diaminopimelate ligase [Planctomycetota bacterium]